ncbi:hypothetical protein [Massilia rubra]|uniref:Uncharacterized protein n=1 Tax=Massilia rubra TaxID=2607910 RepID=A0ABX0LS77_9BURK|nr:hypothetical protein [Massilia rubra]NHZ35191.1 hypothetical protein [Massilia rubra]
MSMHHAALLGLFAGALCGGVAAAGNPDLEVNLMKAMKFDKASEKRIGSSGKAIQAYMKAGYVNQRPNGRADYTDYYLLNKPATLLGHPLVLIEEEYMTRYAGCCVSKGIGVTVGVAGSLGALKKFAAQNRCTLEENVDPGKQLRSFGIKNALPKGTYASLSCRVRDAEQHAR